MRRFRPPRQMRVPRTRSPRQAGSVRSRKLSFLLAALVLCSSLLGDPSARVLVAAQECPEPVRSKDDTANCEACVSSGWFSRSFWKSTRRGMCEWCADGTCAETCGLGNRGVHLPSFPPATPSLAACTRYARCAAYKTCAQCAADTSCEFCAGDDEPSCVARLGEGHGSVCKAVSDAVREAGQCAATVCGLSAMQDCTRCTRPVAALGAGRCAFCIRGTQQDASRHCADSVLKCVGGAENAVAAQGATHSQCRDTDNECCVCDGNRAAGLSSQDQHGHLICEMARLDSSAPRLGRAYEMTTCAQRCAALSPVLGGVSSTVTASSEFRASRAQPYMWVAGAIPVDKASGVGTQETCTQKLPGHFVSCTTVIQWVRALYNAETGRDLVQIYDLTRGDLEGWVRGLDVSPSDVLGTLRGTKVVKGALQVNPTLKWATPTGSAHSVLLRRKEQSHIALDTAVNSEGFAPLDALVFVVPNAGNDVSGPVELAKQLAWIDNQALPFTALFFGFSYADKEYPYGNAESSKASALLSRVLRTSSASLSDSPILLWTESGSPLASGQKPYTFNDFQGAESYPQFLATLRMVVFAVDKMHDKDIVHGGLCPQHVLLKPPDAKTTISQQALPEVFSASVGLSRARVEPRLIGMENAFVATAPEALRKLVNEACIRKLSRSSSGVSKRRGTSEWGYHACMKESSGFITPNLPADFVGDQFALLQPLFQHLYDVADDPSQGQGDGKILLDEAVSSLANVLVCLDVYALGLTLIEAMGFYALADKHGIRASSSGLSELSTAVGSTSSGRAGDMLRKSPSDFPSDVKVNVFNRQAPGENPKPNGGQKAAAVCAGVVANAMPSDIVAMQVTELLSKIARQSVEQSAVPLARKRSRLEGVRIQPAKDKTAVLYWERITKNCGARKAAKCVVPEREFGVLWSLATKLIPICKESAEGCATPPQADTPYSSCDANRDMLAKIVSPLATGPCSPRQLFRGSGDATLAELAFKTPDWVANGENDDNSGGDLSSSLQEDLVRGRSRLRRVGRRQRQLVPRRKLPPPPCQPRFVKAVADLGRTPTDLEKQSLCQATGGCEYNADSGRCEKST